MRYSIFVFFLIISNLSLAQSIKVKPFLQDAQPNSIYVVWETDSGEESIVEWGLTQSLGNTSTGTVTASNGSARIHTVLIENLSSFTKYYYRVTTGTAVSDMFNFKTPPLASDHESFRIIAMSDMQKDSAFPDKFYEMIHDGVLDYLDLEFGGEVIDNLAFVMIPGDLVVNGNNYSSWETDFFTPSEDLFNQVPVYPVLGNHENNSIYYFQYFKLPENGTPGYEEHSWYKDYGNVRIIGLDSNGTYANQEQLDWLDTVLTSACASNDIDFVFAQLHHPHKSELWTPGESNYTGDVIEKLEQFTTDCGKPSIHFFGHTHGYSRGNSRDHKHLWIDVATAGGAIDNWGEFPNADYDEFSVSQDEYGFVSVEVTDDANPTIVIQRISRGDQDITFDNDITDTVTIRLNPSQVSTPSPVYPIDEEVIPECVMLNATSFSSTNNEALHGQSHWQVSTNQNNFSQPIAESWKNFENWYYDIDTQADDDLTDEMIINLNENETYWWRLRYRDRELNWSDWSTPVSFMTGESTISPNLLQNVGAEEDLDNWIITEGIVEALTDGECSGTSPHSGIKYFAVGGLCEESAVGRCIQDVDVSNFSTTIDNNESAANFGGFLSNWGGSDLPEIRLIFLDENGVSLGTSNTLFTYNNSWIMLSEWCDIPVLTRVIRVELKGTRNAGVDNDSYFDDLFLKVGPSDIDCSGSGLVVNQIFSTNTTLSVVPNPIKSRGYIGLPNANYTKLKLFIADTNGSKISCPLEYQSDRIVINRENLIKGVYFFWIKDEGMIIGRGKFIVE